MERPGDLTSYSWRRWGPSVAHLLAFTPERLAALGDWQDRKHVSAETNMPLHYSGVRYTQSLKAKHAVLGAMSFFGGYEDWDMIPASVVMEAREAEVALIDKAVSQDQAVLWALPMSATEIRERFQLTTALKSKAALLRQQSGGTHVARTMPASIAGRTMSDHMKDGSALCAAFQKGRCGRLPEECKGKHRCAAVLRSGRVCGGNHHGQDCRDPRVLKVDVPEVPAQPDPSQKPPEPKHPPRKKARTKLPIQEDPPAVELTPAEQALEDRYDMWATRKDRTAQRPSPIWNSPQGGTLWLSGLPTKETVARFPPATLQISCFPQPVAAKGGVLLPRSINMTVAPSKQKVRDSQWRLAWPVMKTSLQSGEDVLLHCVAGKHRAAGIAVLARSLLAGESLDDAEKAIAQVRTIDMDGLLRDYTVGPWLTEMKRTSTMTPPPPRVTGFMATPRSRVHLMIEGELPLCSHKQAASKAADRLSAPLKTADDLEAAAWGRQICQVCLGKASAAAQLRLEALQ